MTRASEWLEIATDVYLDQRHRNWVLAEELGDVVFIAARDVVLVHCERAEHIARALDVPPDVAQLDVIPLPAVRQAREVGTLPSAHWRAACGWLGIVAGAVVFVAALAVPLDDPALVVALTLAVRGGRLTATA